jgi:hypothetical protein
MFSNVGNFFSEALGKGLNSIEISNSEVPSSG